MKALLFALALVPIAANADLTVSAGGKSGTYYRFIKDIDSVCGDKVRLNILESSGSDQNIARLAKKDTPAADLAPVQSDALQFTAMSDPDVGDNDIRTLLVLYPEEVHVIALADSKVGGFMGIGGKAPSDVTQLQGKTIGAWGGSFTTAKVIQTQANLGISIQQFPNEKEGMAALNAGKVAAIIYVAGQPADMIKNLSNNYVLLDVPPSVARNTTLYTPTKLVSYPKLGQVQSLTAQSLLVVRNFRTAAKKKEISDLKECVVAHLDELKEGDFHAKWKYVDPKASSPRTYYETASTPSTDSASVVVPDMKKKK